MRTLSELTSFDKLVDARFKEIQTRQNDEILWLRAMRKSMPLEPNNVVVGETPQWLVDLGCKDKLVYDKQHFLDSMMLSWDSNHAHDDTPYDLKMLPEVIDKPFAILTEPERMENGKTLKPITFLYANPNERDELGMQIFRKAVVQPQDYHYGILDSGQATKVITYFSPTVQQVNRLLEHTQDGTNKLLYFDAEQYAKVPEMYRTHAMDGQHSIACQKLEGEYIPTPNLDQKEANHMRKLQAAAYVELGRFAQNKMDYYDTHFMPVQYARDILDSSRPSIEELRVAKRLIRESCELVNNPELSRDVDLKMEKKFVPLYERAAMDFIQKMPAQTEEDINKLWEAVEIIAPTNEPMLQGLQDKLCDFVSEKEFELEERSFDHSDEELSLV